MSKTLLVGEDTLVANWAFGNYKIVPQSITQAIGILDGSGKLVAAAIFHNFNGSNIEFSYYGERTFTPALCRAIARTTLAYKVARGTVVTSKRNRRLIRSLLKFGFRVEGAQRCYFGNEDCTKNTGVRLVIFRNDLMKIANPKRPFKGLDNV